MGFKPSSGERIYFSGKNVLVNDRLLTIDEVDYAADDILSAYVQRENYRQAIIGFFVAFVLGAIEVIVFKDIINEPERSEWNRFLLGGFLLICAAACFLWGIITLAIKIGHYRLIIKSANKEEEILWSTDKHYLEQISTAINQMINDKIQS